MQFQFGEVCLEELSWLVGAVAGSIMLKSLPSCLPGRVARDRAMMSGSRADLNADTPAFFSYTLWFSEIAFAGSTARDSIADRAPTKQDYEHTTGRHCHGVRFGP
jgi:hypothetical protein